MRGGNGRQTRNAADGSKTRSPDHNHATTRKTDHARDADLHTIPAHRTVRLGTRRPSTSGRPMSDSNSGGPTDDSRPDVPGEPVEYHHDPDDLTGDMMAAFLIGGFPRSEDLDIFTDEDDQLGATVPHHANYYVPDSVGSDSSEQYRAGPGSEGHPGFHELALSVMAYYLPSGFEETPPVILRTRRPRPAPVKVSRTAWELHLAFAGEVLARIDSDETTIPAGEIYEWVVSKRPDLEYLLYEEPTPDLFDGLF